MFSRIVSVRALSPLPKSHSIRLRARLPCSRILLRRVAVENSKHRVRATLVASGPLLSLLLRKPLPIFPTTTKQAAATAASAVGGRRLCVGRVSEWIIVQDVEFQLDCMKALPFDSPSYFAETDYP